MNLRAIFYVLLIGMSVNFSQAQGEPSLTASTIRGAVQGAATTSYIPVKLAQTITTQLEKVFRTIDHNALLIAPWVDPRERETLGLDPLPAHGNAYCIGFVSSYAIILYLMLKGINLLQTNGDISPRLSTIIKAGTLATMVGYPLVLVASSDAAKSL